MGEVSFTRGTKGVNDGRYTPVIGENGDMHCSCGRPLVRLEAGVYRCKAGYPMYRFDSGDFYKTKDGDLSFKYKEHPQDNN
jgi:hypothetical protein